MREGTWNSKATSFLACWTVVAVLVGGMLMSFHQPFLAPGEKILALAGVPVGGGWRMVHVLSAGCGCSQRVMRHLLERGPMTGVAEQIVVIDGPGEALEGTPELVERLKRKGFRLRRMAAEDVPEDSGLRGVPLLVVASPERRIEYSGGYGSGGDRDMEIFGDVRGGGSPVALPVIGCAVSAHLARAVDPLHIKY